MHAHGDPVLQFYVLARDEKLQRITSALNPQWGPMKMFNIHEGLRRSIEISSIIDRPDWGCFDGKSFSHHVEIMAIDRDQAIEKASGSGHSGPWVNEMLFEAAGGKARSAKISKPVRPTP